MGLLSLVASSVCAPLLATERVPMSTPSAPQASQRLAMMESRAHDGSALETETQTSRPVCAAHFVDRPFRQQRSTYKQGGSWARFQFAYKVKVRGTQRCRRERLQVRLEEPDQVKVGWTLTPIPLQRKRRGASVIADLKFITATPSVGPVQAVLILYDGERALDRLTVEVNIESKWRGGFMPGFHGAYYRPNGATTPAKSDGDWHGVSIEYVLTAWIIKNQRRGPSTGKVSLMTTLLSSALRPELALIYGLRTQLSFERNPARNFLLPHFGAELGGIHLPSDQGAVHQFQLTPQLGVDLLSLPSGFLNISGGYLISGVSQLETLRGWRAQMGLHFTLW
ncbi:MAG: hypothetical protein VYD19_06055 [Myxococcota bacterium]|nr:hypothetical protein [Myxococcota bacterium]